ncbi:MAG: S26 family signal peptidase [Syntrophaceae bacterium]|nr:S26 family signal peptidase [Syntrophaceae bacterium]
MRKNTAFTGGMYGLFILIILSVIYPHKMLVYNYTNSVPLGFYLILPIPFKKGDLIAFEPSDKAKKLIQQRKYLRPDAYLIKHIAGVPGDHLCTLDDTLLVDGINYGAIAHKDREGRELTPYQYCGIINNGFIVAIKGMKNSFDSRYYGPIPEKCIIGKAVPVLLFNTRQQ